MSANDQLVVVNNKDATWEVWHNSCVDNSLVESGTNLQTFNSLSDAVKYAREVMYTQFPAEYGIQFVDGPIVNPPTPMEENMTEQTWLESSYVEEGKVDPDLARILGEEEEIERKTQSLSTQEKKNQAKFVMLGCLGAEISDLEREKRQIELEIAEKKRQLNLLDSL